MRRRRGLGGLVPLGVAVAAVVAALAACGERPPDELDARVVRVVDGDTVVVELRGQSEAVRLLGIDTPETVHPERGEECFGPEASAYTTALLPPGSEVRLERDAVGRDHYGRLLAYVHRIDDGLFVNEELVRQGFAVPLRIEPNEAYADRFVEAARSAEAEDLGLWAVCGG